MSRVDYLSAAVLGALHDGLNAVPRQNLADRLSADRRAGRDRHHGVAMASEDIRLDRVDRYVQFLGQERPEPGGVQDSGHSDHAVLGEAAHLEGPLRHGVQRVGHDDEYGVGRVFNDGLGDRGDDVHVGEQQVVAAHAGPTRYAGGNHHHVRTRRVRVVVRADYAGVGAYDRARTQAYPAPCPGAGPPLCPQARCRRIPCRTFSGRRWPRRCPRPLRLLCFLAL